MLRVRAFEAGHLTVGGDELLAAAGSKWIEVVSPDENILAPLAERYALHRLAIEDCLHLDQRPKLEEYPGHQFLVVQGFCHQQEDLVDLTMHELHMFLGPDWLITVHDQTHPGLDGVAKRVEADPAGTLGRGVDFVCYLLTEAVVDRNFPVLDAFSDLIEGLEDQVFDRPRSALMQEAMRLKNELVRARRVLSPQRDVVGLLARRGIPQVQDRTALFFRDAYDHLARLNEQIDSARDLLGNAVDAYLSVIANRTADVSKQLTVFATIFLPLSFIVGFFGQNFTQVQSQPLFFVMMGSIVALPISMLWWMKHKGWW